MASSSLRKTKRIGTICSVCTSTRTGTRKDPVDTAVLIENYGIRGDAHADSSSHRQISLLARESIKKMQDKGLSVCDGDFAENITTVGIRLTGIPLGTLLCIGRDAVIEITQHGKTCHSPCAVHRQAGACIMPTEGVFARVVQGGIIVSGDHICMREHKH